MPGVYDYEIYCYSSSRTTPGVILNRSYTG